MPASIFQPVPAVSSELTARLRELFDASGTRPGRVSLILPDNLAKISLLSLPERPASRKQLDELVRSKMRRAVPFKLDDARLSYQVLAGAGREISVLVMLIRRALVERLEEALSAAGARPGLIDICTPNLINFCRDQINAASANGGDVALLNCAQNYFSLVIMRNERLIFFRCKTFAVERAATAREPNGALAREISSSFSYYREKLAGEGVNTAFVRTVGNPFDEVESDLRALGLEGVKLIDIEGSLEMGEGVSYDSELGQRLAPAVGAAMGRSG
jgi:Tfp pilus assembly PilM family ATPase